LIEAPPDIGYTILKANISVTLALTKLRLM
jgi:hypothetical protein